MAKLRILVVDDHGLVREGLKALVNVQPDMAVVGEAADGQCACELALELGPDVVVMDVSIPKLDGAQATARVKHARPEVKVLALTFHGDPAYARRLFDAGASGYLLKRAVADDVIRAIRIVASGGTYLDPEVTGSLAVGSVPGTAVAGEPRRNELSEREHEVLRLVALGHTNKEVATQLELGMRAVQTHKARAMEKLVLGSRAELIRYARQQGWLSEI